MLPKARLRRLFHRKAIFSPGGLGAPIISPAGYYAPEGSAAPIITPAGYYAPEGSAAPILSPEGYYSAGGAGQPTITPPGTFSSAGASAPLIPPAGFTAPGGGGPSSLVTAKTFQLIGGNLVISDFTDNTWPTTSRCWFHPMASCGLWILTIYCARTFQEQAALGTHTIEVHLRCWQGWVTYISMLVRVVTPLKSISQAVIPFREEVCSTWAAIPPRRAVIAWC